MSTFLASVVNVVQGHPSQAVLLAMNHETAEVVAPIEYDLEQVVHRCEAVVAVDMQAPPDWRVDVEEQDVELVTAPRAFGWT